jgi:hypothetical protein
MFCGTGIYLEYVGSEKGICKVSNNVPQVGQRSSQCVPEKVPHLQKLQLLQGSQYLSVYDALPLI